jgi:LysM repeat protein
MRGARNPARYLAPLALAATITATYLVVHAGLSTKSTSTTSHVAVHRTGRHHHRGRTPRSYTVRAGDTLSTISARTRIPLATLQALNPGIDPNALQTGQRLTLRR